jgi:hypothetical protein
MRSSLSHSAVEQLPRHRGVSWRPRRGFGRAAQAVSSRAREASKRIGHTHASSASSPLVDPTVQLARAAGGPVDVASYTCRCGLIFLAAVSTSVACPHCGAEQDW